MTRQGEYLKVKSHGEVTLDLGEISRASRTFGILRKSEF